MYANFIAEECTGTNGDITLGGAKFNHIVFSEAFANTDPVSYVIEDADGITKCGGTAVYTSAGNLLTSRVDTWTWNGTTYDSAPVGNITLSGGTHTIRVTLLASNAEAWDTHAALVNEHIDWTNATQNLVTTGTILSGDITLNRAGIGTLTIGDATETTEQRIRIINDKLPAGRDFIGSGATVGDYGFYNRDSSRWDLRIDASGNISIPALIDGVDIAARDAILTSTTSTANNAEPSFSKNTGFNLNLGTTAGTVSEGDHTHAFSSLTSKPTTLSGYGITDAAPLSGSITQEIPLGSTEDWNNLTIAGYYNGAGTSNTNQPEGGAYNWTLLVIHVSVSCVFQEAWKHENGSVKKFIRKGYNLTTTPVWDTWARVLDDQNHVAGTDYQTPQTTIAGYGITDAMTTAHVANALVAQDITDIGNLSGTNSGDNAVNTLYSSLVTDSGVPAMLSSGGLPVLNTGITAAEYRSTINVDVAGTDNSDNNAVNTLYSGLVSDTGTPAIQHNGGVPTLQSGSTAAEIRTLIGAGTSSFDGAYGSLTGAPNVQYTSAIPNATTSVSGLLTSTDWNTFNGKQAALGFTPYNSTNPSGYEANRAISDSTSTTSSTTSASSTAVKAAYDRDHTYAVYATTATFTNRTEQTLLFIAWSTINYTVNNLGAPNHVGQEMIICRTGDPTSGGVTTINTTGYNAYLPDATQAQSHTFTGNGQVIFRALNLTQWGVVSIST